MSVHYKFKSTLDYDTVSFDGLHISVHDLKKAIFRQKRIGKNTDFDLQVTNAQTKEDYTDDNTLIAKNTSLIVSRVPLSVQQKRSWDRSESQALTNTKDESNLGHTADLTRLDGSEDDKIRAMMSQSTQDYDPSNYIKIRNINQTGELPPNYLCYKCHQPGHWIKNCPLGVNQESIEIKKSTGIPRSFMVPVDGPLVPGAMMTPTGHYAVPVIDHQAYKEGKKERPPFSNDPKSTVEKPEIPEDLLCNICKDLLTDAVMIPCCGNSFCDECIRTVLLESEEHECPDCNEKDVSPETLIPNRFLRNAVMTFKNETGYAKQQPWSSASPKTVEVEKTEVAIPVSQSEPEEPPKVLAATQSEDLPSPKDSSQTSTNTDHPSCSKNTESVTGTKDSSSESNLRKEVPLKSTTKGEIEVFPPLPPGTEPLLPIPSITALSQEGNDHSIPSTAKEKICDKRPRERRLSKNKEGHRDRVANLKSANRRNSLSPKESHQSDHPIRDTSSSQLMNSTEEYQNLSVINSSRYTNVNYEPGLRKSAEDRPGTPTVDEPHLHPQLPVNQTPLVSYHPTEYRTPSAPPQNYNQPPPGIAPQNLTLLPDPYTGHRLPMYPQQEPHYGPPRFERPQYQQPRFRPAQPPRNYNGPLRPMRGMPHRVYRAIQPVLPTSILPQSQPLLPLPQPEIVRNVPNGNNFGVIDDPLEAFERMLREKDERDRRLGKHRRLTRSRSRTRSYSRSRSRSFSRRSPLSSCISRSRSPLSKRRLSRSPLPLKQRSRTPKRKSRSGSFSISRSRSYSRSQSPRGSVSHERDRYGRGRDWDRDPQLRYRSPIRFQRDHARDRSRESRERYNSYNDSHSQATEYGARSHNRDLPSTRERTDGRYTSVSLSSQHNIPPLLPHLTSGGHPPPLMSLGGSQTERKDYYDSYNRYAAPSSQRYNSSPVREPFYKRFDDVAPPGTEGCYKIAQSGSDHSQRLVKDERNTRIPKKVENRIEDLNTDNDRVQSRYDRTRDSEACTKEREERARRGPDRNRDREHEREKEERNRLSLCREREGKMRDKDIRERRDKDKDRDTDKYIRDRRDDDRQTEKKEYEKERSRTERDRYKIEDKNSLPRDRERKERGYETEKYRERYDRYGNRSDDRNKSKPSSSPHLQQQYRSDAEQSSLERSKKKDKDYYEEKLDEKKKEKKVKDKKKKKDSEEREKKKRKKKDKKFMQKEIAKSESSKSLSEPEIPSSSDLVKMKDAVLPRIKTYGDDIDPNHMQLMDNTSIMTSHVMQFDEKSLIMNPEPPKLTDHKLSRQADAELSRNPPNPSFKPIPELKPDSKPIDSLYSGLDNTEINSAITEKYAKILNNENEDTNKETAENSSKLTLTPEYGIVNSEGISMTPLQIVSSDVYSQEKLAKKNEFLAPMPELSKWERDDNNAEKLEGTPAGPSLETKSLIQDDSKTTKVVTSEVLKRAENAIFQKAINAIRPIEIKKISDSRKILYQNPETKVVESNVNREIRKSVNVTINISKNERNVEITEPFKKSKLDRSKFKPSETNSPTRVPVRERLGAKIEDKEKSITSSKPFLGKKDAGKNNKSTRSRSPKLVKDKKSPLLERRLEFSLVGNSERKVHDDHKKEREKSEQTEEKNSNKCEKLNSKGENDMEIGIMVDFCAGRTGEIEKEQEKDHRREHNRDASTPLPIVHKHENSLRLTFLKRIKDEDEKKENEKIREVKKSKKEHSSKNKLRDRKKRKEKKRKKDKKKSKTSKHKDTSSSRVNSEIEKKHNHENINLSFQDEQSRRKRKISRFPTDRKRSILDEASFEPDYSALESESDSGNSKVGAKKPKMEREIESSTAKQRTKSTSSDDSSSTASSSTVSDSSDDFQKKWKKKYKKRKSTRKDSSSDDSDSDSTDSSSDDERAKKKSKKSKNKSKQSKKKRKSKVK